MHDPTFADRLSFVLKALSVSRGRFALDVGVDKSLVSRWCSGAIRPSAENLARLTQVVAGRRAGFNMHDWDRDLPALAARFEVALPHEPVRADELAEHRFPLNLLKRPAHPEQVRGADYEGFWRSTRPSSEMPGQFVHDHIMLRRTPDGAMSFTLAIFDVRFHGWAVAQQHQLFVVGADNETGTFVFAILNGVVRQRAEVVDGLVLTCLRDASGTPVASKCLLSRVADLSGDPLADDATLATLARSPPFSTAQDIPEPVRDHIWHDIGPTAFAAGGDQMLMMAFARSMARGPVYEDGATA